MIMVIVYNNNIQHRKTFVNSFFKIFKNFLFYFFYIKKHTLQGVSNLHQFALRSQIKSTPSGVLITNLLSCPL